MVDVPQTRPADQQAVRRHNLALVLNLVRDRGPLSRTDLALATGLNKVTVSSLVSDLLDRRLVRETGQRVTGSVGRPARMLQVDGSQVTVAAAEINVDHVALTLADLAGVELYAETWRVRKSPPSPASAVRTLGRLLAAAEQQTAVGGRVAGLRIAVPGMLDPQSGTVDYAPQLGWSGVELAALVRAELGREDLDVRIDRLANFAVYAERRFGGWDVGDTDDIVLLYGDVGVGAAHLVEGRLQRGSAGLAGEFGHLPLDPRGPECDCGRSGCLEALVGLRPLARVAGLPALDLEAAMTVAESGTSAMRRELERQGKWLGRGAATVIHLLDPRMLVLGGYFTRLAPLLSKAFDAELRARLMPPHQRRCRVVTSRLGRSAPLRGGIALLADELLADPARLPARST